MKENEQTEVEPWVQDKKMQKKSNTEMRKSIVPGWSFL